jgi:hypothetical protein
LQRRRAPTRSRPRSWRRVSRPRGRSPLPRTAPRRPGRGSSTSSTSTCARSAETLFRCWAPTSCRGARRSPRSSGRTGALAGVNGGYFVIGNTDGTDGDAAGIANRARAAAFRGGRRARRAGAVARDAAGRPAVDARSRALVGRRRARARRARPRARTHPRLRRRGRRPAHRAAQARLHLHRPERGHPLRRGVRRR